MRKIVRGRARKDSGKGIFERIFNNIDRNDERGLESEDISRRIARHDGPCVDLVDVLDEARIVANQFAQVDDGGDDKRASM